MRLPTLYRYLAGIALTAGMILLAGSGILQGIYATLAIVAAILLPTLFLAYLVKKMADHTGWGLIFAAIGPVLFGAGYLVNLFMPVAAVVAPLASAHPFLFAAATSLTYGAGLVAAVAGITLLVLQISEKIIDSETNSGEPSPPQTPQPTEVLDRTTPKQPNLSVRPRSNSGSRPHTGGDPPPTLRRRSGTRTPGKLPEPHSSVHITSEYDPDGEHPVRRKTSTLSTVSEDNPTGEQLIRRRTNTLSRISEGNQ